MKRIPVRDIEGRTGKQFIKELFKYENCPECNGSEKDHIAINIAPILGDYADQNHALWFARCNKNKHLIKGRIRSG